MNNPTQNEIKAARSDAGLSQKDSAAMVYVDIRTWQKWEYGERKMPWGLWELFLIKTEKPKAQQAG